MTPYLRAANVKDGTLDLTDVKEMNFDSAERHAFSLLKGDVLVTEGSGSIGAVGASAIWQGEISGAICFQNTLLRLRPRSSTNARFLAWWCRHAFADGLFASVASGANIFHLSAERVRSLPMMYLGLERQRVIADFLDTETARIDALITKKRQLMETVASRQRAAVWCGVTGQTLKAPRRASGVSWIGTTPAHWETPWLGAHFDVQLGKMLDAKSSSGVQQFRYIRNANVQWDRIDLDDLASMHFDEGERRRYTLLPGDLLVCEGGEVGRSAVWPGVPGEEVFFQKAIHRVRPIRAGNVRFVMYCLMAAASLGVFAIEGNQSTIVHLTREQLRAHRLPFPSISEQEVVVEELDRNANRVRSLSVSLLRQISLLQEHRQALITAAVTGELDIPGVAA